MLHYKAVSDRLHRLLKGLQSDPDLADTRLVGGTALALQYGHRISVDLDFFGRLHSTTHDLSQKLSGFGEVMVIKDSKNIKAFIVDEIKVDFVDYSYKWIDESVYESGLTLASPKDIAAMKVAAITGRGSKKDFIDFYFLLGEFSIEEILNFYDLKYPDASRYLALKSLTFFDDADVEPSPKMLKNVSWENVKQKVLSEVSGFVG